MLKILAVAKLHCKTVFTTWFAFFFLNKYEKVIQKLNDVTAVNSFVRNAINICNM